MPHTNIVLHNEYGGMYNVGRPLGKAKWILIASIYDRELQSHGRCTVRKLAVLASVSKNTAWQAMQLIIPTEQQRDHGHRGPGSILRLTMVYHSFIFAFYLDNPSMPLYGYVEELEIKFSLVVSIGTMHNWFMSIGPFKCTLRITSRFSIWKIFVSNLLYVMSVPTFHSEHR